MVSVVVHYNDSPLLQGNHLLKRWLSFYVFTMQAFGVKELIVIGGPEIAHGYAMNVKNYKTIDDMLQDYSKHKLVLLTKEGRPLDTYKHPKGNVLYIVGDDYGIEGDIPKAEKVTIENPGNITHLWGHNCIAIALYDRSVKHGGN